MPTGLSITSVKNEAGVTKTTLTFNQVADANGYVIFIDGNEIKGLNFTTENNIVSADISQYVNKVGDHYVRVKAVNTPLKSTMATVTEVLKRQSAKASTTTTNLLRQSP